MISAALSSGGALSALATYKQFILVRLVPDRDNPGKTYKYPVSLHDVEKAVDAHNRAYWMTADEAIEHVQRLGTNFCVGFVFTSNDPFFFIDIDGAWNGQNWSTLATDLCVQFAGCAMEVSQSGTGLHIIGSYAAKPEHTSKNVQLSIECYTELRFVALTGVGATGSAWHDATLPLWVTANTYFTPGVDKSHDWTDKPVEEYGEELADEVLIQKAMRSQSAAATFGAKATFKQLFNADADKLSQIYPHETKPYDASSADAALASILAFWTGKNCAQIDRIMRKSKLVRPKWDYHRTYMHKTITSACARQGGVYQQRMKRETVTEFTKPFDNDGTISNASDITPQVKTSAGQWMNAETQIDYFKGCVYIQDIDRILVPSGMLLKQSQFKASYGGYLFEFSRGNKGKDKTNAWEVFTESQIVNFPKVETTCFKPDEPYGTVHKGQSVNIYHAKFGERKKGDITPFLIHVEKLIPNEHDRDILLSYMAACVQYAGRKFQWCPLIQGVEGNGKTLLLDCVEYAVGEDYSHRPKGAKIASQFNGWMLNKLLIGVEEIHVSDRVDLYEYLKDYITNKRLEVEKKGVDQDTKEICCNFMMYSNHKDGMLKKRNDRRCAPFFTAQQDIDDLERDGMTDEYFHELYSWVRNGGLAYVAEYLWTRPINTNVFGRAPRTSSTNEAIYESLGQLEGMVQDAMDRCEEGMFGDIILGTNIQTFLERRHKIVSPRKIGYMMRELGYITPKNVDDGRISIDGRRHRVYVKKNSYAEHMTAIQLEIEYKRQQIRRTADAFGPLPVPPPPPPEGN